MREWIVITDLKSYEEMLSSHIIELIGKYCAGVADAEESAALEQWLVENPEQRDMVDRLKSSKDWRRSLETYLRAIGRSPDAEEIVIEMVREEESDHRTRVLYMWGWRVAAACIMFLLAGGGWWLIGRKPAPAVAPVASRPALAPGSNRATLILADQKEISLDDAQTGSLARQGNTNVIKFDSASLVYAGNQSLPAAAVLSYNTVITPRAGQYKLRLVDGTIVYLNAQSSLRFPVAFGGKERKVQLTGEGYFEVAKDAARPFKVDMGKGREVTVLGTRFDAKAYDDDPGAAATLLDGSVRVTNGGRSMTLEPAQQATLDPGGALTVAHDDDAEASISWTKGLFRFNNLPLADVLRQLSRWYDVDVVFNGAPNIPITASINRNTTAWEVLDALKEIAGLKYTVEGRKIIVSH